MILTPFFKPSEIHHCKQKKIIGAIMNFFIQNNKTLNFTVKNTVTHETDICIHYVLKFIPNLRFIFT